MARMLLRKNCLVKTTPHTPMHILFPSPRTILQAATQVGVEVGAKHHGACDAAIQDPCAREETPGLALAVRALRSAPQSANPHFTKSPSIPFIKKKKKGLGMWCTSGGRQHGHPHGSFLLPTLTRPWGDAELSFSPEHPWLRSRASTGPTGPTGR